MPMYMANMNLVPLLMWMDMLYTDIRWWCQTMMMTVMIPHPNGIGWFGYLPTWGKNYYRSRLTKGRILHDPEQEAKISPRHAATVASTLPSRKCLVYGKALFMWQNPSLLPKMSWWQLSVSQENDWNVFMCVWSCYTERVSYTNTYTHFGLLPYRYRELLCEAAQGCFKKPQNKGGCVKPLRACTHIHPPYAHFSLFLANMGRCFTKAPYKGASQRPKNRGGFTKPLNWGEFWKLLNSSQCDLCAHICTFWSFLLQIWHCFAKLLADSRGFVETLYTGFLQCFHVLLGIV